MALNGKFPGSVLVALSTRGRLLKPVAASYERLRKEYEADTGLKLEPSGSSDAYRSYEVQEATFRARYRTAPIAGRPRRWWQSRWWYQLPGTAAAAVPGTSNHGLGVAVDFAGLGGFGGKGYAWLSANAARHGWSNTEGRSVNEYWHWVRDGSDRYPWRKVEVTGAWDLATRYALQRALGRRVTSAGSRAGTDALWRAIQRRLNSHLAHTKGFRVLTVDGDPGPATIKALQTYLRRVLLTGRPGVDGVLGPNTVKALQRALNAKRF